MSFMIGCGFINSRFKRDTSLLGASAYLLDLKPSELLSISKDEIKGLLTQGELEDTSSNYVYIYLALNYRFFSERSAIWFDNKGSNTGSRLLSYITKSGDSFFAKSKGRYILIDGNTDNMGFQYPYEVANNVSPTIILSASTRTPLEVRDRLTLKFNREDLMNSDINFNLRIIRGGTGLDDYTKVKGSGALFGNTYFVGDVLSRAFTIQKEKSEEERVLGKWDDSLINKKVYISFANGSPTSLETTIKEENAPSATSFTSGVFKRERQASLFKREDNLVCLIQTKDFNSDIWRMVDTEVRTITITG